ncbi:MAG: ATP-binding protein [Crocinitomicaceae bacterium]
MIKIAITGPESCGKTTLAEALSHHFDVDYIPEFARSFLTELDRDYTFFDLDAIAEGQLRSTCAKVGQPFMISDTEMLVLKIWSEFKFNNCSPYIEQLWEEQDFDLYVLCSPDIPYEDDPLRENPKDREELFQLYLNELENSDRKFIVVRGDVNSRLDEILLAIEQLK